MYVPVLNLKFFALMHVSKESGSRHFRDGEDEGGNPSFCARGRGSWPPPSSGQIHLRIQDVTRLSGTEETVHSSYAGSSERDNWLRRSARPSWIAITFMTIVCPVLPSPSREILASACGSAAACGRRRTEREERERSAETVGERGVVTGCAPPRKVEEMIPHLYLKEINIGALARERRTVELADRHLECLDRD
jgi:hypothetical protein